MLEKFKSWLGNYREERRKRLWPEAQIIVAFNDVYISAKYPSGEEEKAYWENLNKIEVFTNDSGPWGADVWYIITSEDGQCKYPQGAAGDKEALDYLLALENFNEKEFIKAMGCTSNAQFLCWEK